MSGQATTANISATVIASTAIQADALATALLVMNAQNGLALIEGVPDAEARITDSSGEAHTSEGWKTLSRKVPARLARVANMTNNSDQWIGDWVVELNYKAPSKREHNDPDFRSPYMAMWITDKANRPVRTIMLVGINPKYQRENFVWWNLYRDQAPKMVGLRASATSLSGRYALYWPGYDDSWNFVPLGDYVLHVETSQERGKHTYRTVPLVLGKTGFTSVMPATKDGGGLDIVYGKRE
jgi:thiamine biosynthesis lipoprotein